VAQLLTTLLALGDWRSGPRRKTHSSLTFT
jgi:hypothetical protein